MNKFAIPGAIIVAGGIIAIAVLMSSDSSNHTPQPAQTITYDATEFETLIDEIGVADNILGDPDAPIILVEYSDTECPFCKRFHGTMKQVMETYGTNGDVAWQYKHFPVAQLHQKAPHEAEALECIQKTSGDKAFWTAIDILYETTPGNDGLDHALLPQIVEQSGADVDSFNECLNNNETEQIVESEVQEARTEGGTGTPFSVVKLNKPANQQTQTFINQINEQHGSHERNIMNLASNNTEIKMNGAMPFQILDQLFQTILEKDK